MPGLSRLHALIRLGLAYKAKLLASGVFVSGRPAQSILSEDLGADDLAPLRLLPAAIDHRQCAATAWCPGFRSRSAHYRPGLGCALRTPGQPIALAGAVETAPISVPPLPEQPDERLESVLDWAFAESDPRRPRRTRAVLVLRDGAVVAERYAPGFHAAMPLPGWSLAKLASNALTGILVGECRLDPAAPAPVPEWQTPGDSRQNIRIYHLLRMESGLEFSEDHGDPVQDVTAMLLMEPDAAAFATRKPLRSNPGQVWHYASGSTIILCRLLRQVMGEADAMSFPRRALFGPLGMSGAVLETDPSGTFLGSSFLYATARDWARLGQLYLEDGWYGGRRILPAGWVSDSLIPTATSGGRYGAHIWLKPFDARAAPLPPDAFHGVGFEQQYLSVIPSQKLVAVRLGLTRRAGAWRQDEFLRRLLEALKP